jgi:putative N6-adenine-specific DNA methylase
MYIYQQIHRYLAQIPDGMAELASAELSELGAQNIEPVYRGVYFDADQETLYRINYMSRLLVRILAPLANFDCHSTKYLYRMAREIDWSEFLTLDRTFAVFANVANSKISHSKYAALCLKDAIVDSFRERCGERPNIDPNTPDLWINLFISGNKATINIDLSGGSLHRRGYRQVSVEAPMQETVAATIIRLAEWDGERPLYDPMCGSGTLLSEALMSYSRVPAGFLRQRFGFEFMPDFDGELWCRVRQAADSQIRELPEGLIAGSDISPENLAAARTNNDLLPGGERIGLKTADFRELPPMENTTIVCNPPYGIRLGRDEDIGAFYKEIGDFLKQKCTGSTAYIYCGERKWVKKIGLKATWKKPILTGGLDGRLAKYELY